MSRLLSGSGLAVDSVRRPRQRDIALDGHRGHAGQHVADLLVRVRRAELPEVLPGASLGEEGSEEPLDRLRHLGGGDAIAHGAGHSGVRAHRAAHAEVVGVDQAPVDLQFLALQTQIGDPVLAAAVRAAGDVDLQVLLESGQPGLEIGHEAACEPLGLRQGDLAELRARACDGPAPEGGCVDAKPEGLQLLPEILGETPRHVEDEEVLHARGAQVARAVALGELSYRAKLDRGEPTAQHGDADIGKAGLLLWVNAHVVAIHVLRRSLRHAGVERLAEARLELGEEPCLRPAVMQEEELETGLLATLAKHVAVAEDLRDPLDHGGPLVPRHEGVEPPRQVRIRGEPTAHAHGEPELPRVGMPQRCQPHVVDLGAPVQHGRARFHERRGVGDLVPIHARHRATRDVAGDVAAGAEGADAHLVEPGDDSGQVLDAHPVKLDVLPHREVDHPAGVALREIGDTRGLAPGEETVGNADTHEQMAYRLTLAARAPDRAHPVALGVDPPPAEIRVEPLGRNRIPSLTREALDLRVARPGIELALEPLRPLRLRLLDALAHAPLPVLAPKRRKPGAAALAAILPAFVLGFDLCPWGVFYPVYVSGTATHALQRLHLAETRRVAPSTRKMAFLITISSALLTTTFAPHTWQRSCPTP